MGVGDWTQGAVTGAASAWFVANRRPRAANRRLPICPDVPLRVFARAAGNA
jgi:hypothetical protein